jgi:hypothetical protein
MWTASAGKLKSIAVCGSSWTIRVDFDGGADGNEKNQSRQVQKDTPNRRGRAGDTEREAGNPCFGNGRHGCKNSSKKGRAGDTEREAGNPCFGNGRHGCKNSSKKGRAGDTEREAGSPCFGNGRHGCKKSSKAQVGPL